MTASARAALTGRWPAELTACRPIPLGLIVLVELRKMLNTRSGVGLTAGIGGLALLATVAVIAFGRDDQVTHSSFVAAIGIPLSLLLPMIAILSVTAEWSQRTGLTTFALVPDRRRVIAAKAIASLGVTAVATPLAFAIGALGTVTGASLAAVEPVWDLTTTTLLTTSLGNALSVLVGFMIGVLVRRSPAALMTYVVHQVLLPTLGIILAQSQSWYREARPWVDFDDAQKALFGGVLTAQDWGQLGVTGLVWWLVPLAIGLRLVVRADVR